MHGLYAAQQHTRRDLRPAIARARARCVLHVQHVVVARQGTRAFACRGEFSMKFANIFAYNLPSDNNPIRARARTRRVLLSAHVAGARAYRPA